MYTVFTARGYNLSHACRSSVIPNGIHTETRLLHIQMRHPPQKLFVPPIHLHPALLIIAQGQPLIAPGAGTHSVRMAPASRRRVQTNLPLNLALLAELESGYVTRQLGRVGPRRGEEVFRRRRGEDDVGAVHFRMELVHAWRDERVGFPGVDGHAGFRVDAVDAETVAPFHEGVQVGTRGVDLDPAGMVIGVWGRHGSYEGEEAGLHVLNRR